ncbi:tetratricopeptide repeat protein [Streptomyces sp. NPDC059063]|uniref:tetratricopeptide repeat protein n=1 Tax=unclassified Streptomyces TaxID=2593676 RepID=UPI00368BFDD6
MTGVPGPEETARLLARIRAELARDPTAPRPAPGLHSTALALHHVRDPDSGAPLVPTYSHLAEQIQSADARWRKATRDWPDSPDLQRVSAYLPFPCPLMPLHLFPSPCVAVIDSGVLADHPLLAGRLACDPLDVTGEGPEDICGHGTVQAVRQVLCEPGCRIVSVKAFRGPDGLIGVDDLLAALQALLPLDVGFVFMAGGIDLSAYPEHARRVEEAVEAFLEAKGLRHNFVATTGNRGRSARWWPAECPSVLAIGVVDERTYRSATGARGGLTITQRGPLASFPDLTPLPIPEFRLRYAERFLTAGFPDLADAYAREAEQHPGTAPAATDLRIRVALARHDPGRAEELARAALASAPGDRDALVRLAQILLLGSGREAEAERCLAAVLAARPADADALALRGVARERGGHSGEVDDFAAAARLAPAHLVSLQACAVRAFYREEFAKAERASALLAELDPSWACALHNQAVSAFFAGRPRRARRLVRAYVRAARLLDTSDRRVLPDAVLALMRGGDRAAQEAQLVFVTDSRRQHAPAHTALLRTLRSGTCAPVPEREALRLALGVRDAVERVLLYAGPEEAARLAAGIVPLSARLRAGGGRAAAEAHETTALLRLRTGEHRGAAEEFAAAARCWEKAGRRRKEAALAHEAYAWIAAGELGRADSALTAAMEYATQVRARGPRQETVTTLMTAQVGVGRAVACLARGDAAGAREHTQQALDREGGVNDGGVRGDDLADWLANVDTLLALAAVHARDGTQTEVDAALAPLLRIACEDGSRMRALLRRVEDLPFLNVPLPDGCALHRHLVDMLQRLDVVAVRCTNRGAHAAREGTESERGRTPHRTPHPHTPTTDGTRPTPGTPTADDALPTDATPPSDEGILVAVLGSGLDPRDPAVAPYLVGTADFAHEAPDDDKGTGTDGSADSTAYARALLDSVPGGGPHPRLLSVRVLGPGGNGAVSWLVQGLVWARHQGARVVLAPVETNVFDQHLIGTVQRLAAHGVVVVVDRPPAGRGTVFPGQVAEHVVIT